MKTTTMSKKTYRTDILFPRTSALIGAGSIFNIAGNYFEFNRSQTAEEADWLALANDWGMVGRDLKTVIAANPNTAQLENA